MATPMLPRLGAACGIVFPIAMFLAVGDGSSFSTYRAVIATWSLVLAMPFLAYLCGLLRRAEGEGGWLSTTALVAGLVGVTLKLASHAPALAIHHRHLADGTPLRRALDDMSGGATVMSLYPLAVACAAIALVALRTGALPRWLAAGAALTAVALAVNGGFLFAGFVPALLLFLAWCAAAGVVLYRGARVPAVAAVAA